jgi:hypothetical protein
MTFSRHAPLDALPIGRCAEGRAQVLRKRSKLRRCATSLRMSDEDKLLLRPHVDFDGAELAAPNPRRGNEHGRSAMPSPATAASRSKSPLLTQNRPCRSVIAFSRLPAPSRVNFCRAASASNAFRPGPIATQFHGCALFRIRLGQRQGTMRVRSSLDRLDSEGPMHCAIECGADLHRALRVTLISAPVLRSVGVHQTQAVARHSPASLFL